MARCTRATPSNAFASVKINHLFRASKRLPLDCHSQRHMANAGQNARQVPSLYDGSLVAGAPLPPVTLVLRPAEANLLCNRGCTYAFASASEVHGSF